MRCARATKEGTAHRISLEREKRKSRAHRQLAIARNFNDPLIMWTLNLDLLRYGDELRGGSLLDWK